MEENNFYFLSVKCKNCHIKYEEKIIKGMSYKDVKCKNCELKELDEQRPDSFGIDPRVTI